MNKIEKPQETEKIGYDSSNSARNWNVKKIKSKKLNKQSERG